MIMFFKKYFILIVLCGLLILVLALVTASVVRNNPRTDGVRQFPAGFQFGAATSSYQIEGAWNEDGKSLSIWDVMVHSEPSPISDGSTGDIANDSYRQYRRDVEMMRELGLDYYRLSLSWPRILSNSFADQINEAGVQYYNNLIDEMLLYNIQPMITLYHWELPQKLQDLGGWTNPHIIDWFADYARVVFELFGDRVKFWLTLNEPIVVCQYGYGTDFLAPRVNIAGVADYICLKNLLLAHAKVWHIYNEEFRLRQGGILGIGYSAQYFQPESEEHVEAADEFFQFTLGIYANPIYSETGDYPQIVKERVAAKSLAQGFPRSRLQELSAEEIDYIKGTADFFGLNHYSSYVVYRNESVSDFRIPSFEDDIGAISYQPSDWDPNSNRIKGVPWGFYNLLGWLRERYNNPVIYITENGYDTTGGLNDDERIYYIRTYLDAMLDAIEEGSNIQGYTVWSLMDNFEWTMGYTQKFGLYEVDYDSPERTRTPRKSAFVYKEIIRTHLLDFNYEPEDITTITIDELR